MSMTPMIRISRSGAALGAEVAGVEFGAPLPASVTNRLKAAWSEHGVLVFRGQSITNEDQVRFARHFGRLEKFTQPNGTQPFIPEIFRSANTDEAGQLLSSGDERIALLRLNWLWHIDGSYRTMPVKGVVLRAVHVAQQGGDTVFADNAAAFETLPDAMKKRLAGLTVIHNFAHLVRKEGFHLTSEEEERLPRAEHPLVRQHVDGRRSLYLSPPYMEKISGWNEADSHALINELMDWATQERFIFRHQWRPHDVIVWDNAWTMHKVTPYDIAHDRRSCRGATILGDERVLPMK